MYRLIITINSVQLVHRLYFYSLYTMKYTIIYTMKYTIIYTIIYINTPCGVFLNWLHIREHTRNFIFLWALNIQ